ncbi:YphA family membrane protein [Bacillus seohaeanensis]|jgi:hypothetical protein|uniref:Uncharacterized protein n=1 Tax=Bacillus seohaeanensis TaxID=284580 RepID=A0ABW5RLK4_9BACI
MEGIFYLWILWAIWVYTTFLLNKNVAYRYSLSCFLLVLIILFPIELTIYSYKISAPLLMLLTVGIYKSRTFLLKEKLYLLLSSITVGLIYSSLQLLAIYDPVWVIVDQKWMFSIISMVSVYLLFSNAHTSKKRIVTLVMGSIIGEFFAASVLLNVGFPYTIGSYAFLDYLSVCLLGIMFMHIISGLHASIVRIPTRKGEMKNL